jgi:hypothetical protein
MRRHSDMAPVVRLYRVKMVVSLEKRRAVRLGGLRTVVSICQHGNGQADVREYVNAHVLIRVG